MAGAVVLTVAVINVWNVLVISITNTQKTQPYSASYQCLESCQPFGW
jgi:hypothetical protein